MAGAGLVGSVIDGRAFRSDYRPLCHNPTGLTGVATLMSSANQASCKYDGRMHFFGLIHPPYDLVCLAGPATGLRPNCLASGRYVKTLCGRISRSCDNVAQAAMIGRCLGVWRDLRGVWRWLIRVRTLIGLAWLRHWNSVSRCVQPTVAVSFLQESRISTSQRMLRDR